jgi:hypothetical protein
MASVTSASLMAEISALLPLAPQTPEDFDQLILNQTISRMVNHALGYAQENGRYPELVHWLQQEINGYSQDCPSYRQLVITYIDAQGQAIGGLQDYEIYPIGLGIAKLETHLKNGLTMRLPAPVQQFLSQQCKREVYAAYVSPALILRLATEILRQIQEQLIVIV